MNDVQWLKLAVTLPHYMEDVLERTIDLGNEDELQRFHQFRNDVEKLIDQYYGGNNG